MVTFRLHNLCELVRMTGYHEFDYKPLAILCSWWIYLLHNRWQRCTSNSWHSDAEA